MKMIIKEIKDSVDFVKKYDLPKETELLYEDLEIETDDRNEYIDFEYKVPTKEVLDRLTDLVVDELTGEDSKEYNKVWDIDPFDKATDFLINYIMTHGGYEEYLDKYNEELLKYFEDEALEAAYDAYEKGDY